MINCTKFQSNLILSLFMKLITTAQICPFVLSNVPNFLKFKAACQDSVADWCLQLRSSASQNFPSKTCVFPPNLKVHNKTLFRRQSESDGRQEPRLADVRWTISRTEPKLLLGTFLLKLMICACLQWEGTTVSMPLSKSCFRLIHTSPLEVNDWCSELGESEIRLNQ